jgi:phosphatidylinositol 4-kinase
MYLCVLRCAAQAAAFMRSQIADAYDKWTTGFYDYIQSLQNKIPY